MHTHTCTAKGHGHILHSPQTSGEVWGWGGVGGGWSSEWERTESVCVCVCVRERERERRGQGGSEEGGGRDGVIGERGKQSVHVMLVLV